jgi:hybrid cluster-associated redox disulfide protein
MEKITKDMIIGDVIRKYPQVVETLLENGIHCIGCHASAHESLEQGLKGHGMDDEKVDALIQKLNKVIEEGKKVCDSEGCH